jgi:tRNA(fMet)-specific endonuclease VapC
MRRILLDTDTCIEVIRGRPTPLEDYAGASFGISAITRFELHSGLAKQRNRKLSNRTRSFLEAITCFPFDSAASEAATKVRLELEAKGTKTGASDTLIAGHCVALEYELLTGNFREFSRIKNLKIIALRWLRDLVVTARSSGIVLADREAACRSNHY